MTDFRPGIDCVDLFVECTLFFENSRDSMPSKWRRSFKSSLSNCNPLHFIHNFDDNVVDNNEWKSEKIFLLVMTGLYFDHFWVFQACSAQKTFQQ